MEQRNCGPAASSGVNPLHGVEKHGRGNGPKPLFIGLFVPFTQRYITRVLSDVRLLRVQSDLVGQSLTL